jgi:2-polyprenyl-3-methyl-5-hydroxy-6-metoxy-1,4-benzoquinol methylase
VTLAARLFHALAYREARDRSSDAELAYEEGSLRRFLGRFDPPLRFASRTVLDVGCGGAVLCVEAARQGAQHVTGVDLGIDVARAYVEQQDGEVAAKVSLVRTAGDLSELGDQRFDMIVSKDSFEHYDEPENFITTMTDRLNPGGELVIGFGPLWKSPFGGHINYMTWVPWAHLLFAERVIMDERRRFRPNENARHWSEIQGGLNQMTLQRFQRIIQTSGLECVYFATNVSDNRVVKAMDTFSKVPGLREFFTANVYAILRQRA